MSKVQTLRAFVNQRLSAAAQEIFELFETTVAEYEEELYRQRKLLDAVFKPDVQLHSADVQVLLVCKDEHSPEQQKWTPSPDKEDPPELPHIKEEQEELWTSQEEGEKLQELEESGTMKFTFYSVPVKSEEDDEEKPQSSQLHQIKTEEVQAEADEEDCGGSEPARNFNPGTYSQPATSADETSHSSGDETDDSSCDWVETREHRKTSVSASECSTSFGHKGHLKKHKGCSQKNSLTPFHSEGKRFSCSICKTSFHWRAELVRHMRMHTGEKPFTCSVCGKGYGRKSTLTSHTTVHTGEKPYKCPVCKVSFGDRATLFRHKSIHTGERPFNCSVCGKTFARKQTLRQHFTIHTGEKAFSCSVCDKRFRLRSSFRNHKCVGKSKEIK